MALDTYAIENGLPRQSIDYTLGQQVQAKSGQYPGLLGFTEPAVIPEDPSSRQLILDHWDAGGILMSSIFLGNGPAKWNGNGGSNLDTIMNDPRYIALLDAAVADYLYYQSRGVVFLARVFPEMNGNWNWFSFGTAQQYKNLYIHYYNYMVSHGVHNLLYWYCPDGGFGKYLQYYPGDQYVDLVGLDWYGDIDSAPLIKVPGYDELLTTGKPFMLSEYGPFDSVTPFTYQPGKDFAQTLAGFKANMPKAIGWMNWSPPFNLSAMSNLTSMTDSYIQNRPVPWNTVDTLDLAREVKRQDPTSCASSPCTSGIGTPSSP
jgi:mannan endo-1,4-beta-mannosidase